MNDWGWGNVKTIVQGVIIDKGSEGLWKLMTGKNPMDGWQGTWFSGPSIAILTALSWVCVGMQRRGVRPFPVHT